MKIDARLLVRLYPRGWRERYVEEFLAFTGAYVSWPVAANIVVAALRCRLETAGYAPARLGRMLVNLSGAFMAVMAAVAVKDGRFEATAVAKFALAWLVFALIAMVLGAATDVFSWRRRFPSLSRLLVQTGVFIALVVAYAATIRAGERLSSHSWFVIGLVLTCALIVGAIVESAQLGRREAAE